MRTRMRLGIIIIGSMIAAAVLTMVFLGGGGKRVNAAVSASPPPVRLDTTPAQGEIRHDHFTQRVDSKTWSLTSFTNERGELCAGEKVSDAAGEQAQGLTCRNPSTLFVRGAVLLFVGSQRSPQSGPHWDNIWVWGWAAPTVARLELEFSDCHRIPLPIDRTRLFFHVIPAGLIRSNVTPTRLVGYDSSNALVSDRAIKLKNPVSGDIIETSSTC